MTTRTLVILRHAKAANPGGVADVNRPLTSRGHADAAAAGSWLVHRGLVPDIVLCSPARRTRETWHGVALALSAAPEVRYDELVYSASQSDLLDVVRSLPPTATTALLIGHNPAVSRLSIALDPELADRDGLRTAAAAVHAWEGHWDDCGPEVAQLTASHTARAEV